MFHHPSKLSIPHPSCSILFNFLPFGLSDVPERVEIGESFENSEFLMLISEMSFRLFPLGAWSPHPSPSPPCRKGAEYSFRTRDCRTQHGETRVSLSDRDEVKQTWPGILWHIVKREGVEPTRNDSSELNSSLLAIHLESTWAV